MVEFLLRDEVQQESSQDEIKVKNRFNHYHWGYIGILNSRGYKDFEIGSDVVKRTIIQYEATNDELIRQQRIIRELISTICVATY